MLLKFESSVRVNLVKYVLLVCCCLCISSLDSFGQDSVAFQTAIRQLEKRDNVKFFYRQPSVLQKRISSASMQLPLKQFLDNEVGRLGLGYVLLYENRYVILYSGKNPTVNAISSDAASSVSTTISAAGPSVTEGAGIRGVVIDALTGEPVPGATVFDVEQQRGVVTNHAGEYLLPLSQGTHNIRVSAIGKAQLVRPIDIGGDMRMDFEVFEKTTELDNVTITADGMNRNVASVGMSQVKIDIKTLKSMPPFVGEVDIVRGLLLLPGVSTVGEGSSGFNVRGGNVDQNLILLDEVPLFNSSHLFGFFSTFNPDMVKDVMLYKGGMPANFGGRISSVLDVKLKDGNQTKFSSSGGIGVISSRLLVEGPIGPKTSFIVGGRYAYPDWALKRVPDLNVAQSSSSFYDVNLRVKHQFNDRNSLALSVYRSQDNFKFAADTTYGWNTTNFSLVWRTAITKRLVGNVNAIYSQYKNKVTGFKPTYEFDAEFGIDTREVKADLTYFSHPSNRVDFGASLTSYVFAPGKLTPGEGSSLNPVELQTDFGTEQGFYASDELKINERITINAGLRYSRYSNYGSGNVLVYDPLAPRHPSTVVDTLSYGEGETIRTYSGWEPRFSAKINVDDQSAVKLSFNRNMQYLQLISNTSAISPLDLWKTSNYYIKPQSGIQVATGYFRNFFNNRLESSIEVYYKRTHNVVEYKNGANLFLNPYLESELLNAEGKAYGVEMFVKRNVGKLTGWISYTYSRSFVRTIGATPEETINKGEYYPSNFDKPNNASIVGNYAFTRRLSLSANFTYSTGRPITYPTSVYVIDGYSFAQFTERNQARIPDYHRLDLSFTVEESLRRTKKWKGSWTFALYNVYGRKNAYSVFFRPQYTGSQTQSYRLAVVGTIFPSITYNFRF
jgi:outer membrane receptor protein involved in Fe transport